MGFNGFSVSTVLLGLFVSYLCWVRFRMARTAHGLRHIPTVGLSGIFSYWDPLVYFGNGYELIQEGYNQFNGTPFKISLMSKWLVIISGKNMLDDIRRAPTDIMSFDDAVAETVQSNYTMGKGIRHDHYHLKTVQTPLTRNISVCFDDIKDEIECAFSDIIPNTDDWTPIPALLSIMKVVVRTSNRLFVGLPLCRDPDYMALNMDYTIDVFKRGSIINMFPDLLKPIVGRLISNVSTNQKRMLSHVGPMIRHQLEQDKLHGSDWEERPNNLISWLLEDAAEHNKTEEDLALRLLTVNFAAVHTTSHALTQTLYDLASRPEYVKPLRDEIEEIVDAEGWTKSAMAKLRKVDSFIKESMRMNVGAVQMTRRVRKDFTFSNGVTIPAGTHVAFATNATHMDENLYENPREFDGYRFVNMREEEGQSMRHQIVSLSDDFLNFGAGRYACPGRFLAANELKCMLSYILLHYDFRLPDDAPRPQNFWLQGRAPTLPAHVMFRKRTL